jgi:hypothetical protein
MANYFERLSRDKERFKQAYDFLDQKYSFVYDFELGFPRFQNKEKSGRIYTDDYFGINDLYIELIFNNLELKKSSIVKLIYLLAKPKENGSHVIGR